MEKGQNERSQQKMNAFDSLGLFCCQRCNICDHLKVEIWNLKVKMFDKGIQSSFSHTQQGLIIFF